MTGQVEFIDRVPVSQLVSRYGIARSNLYLRMKDLGIQVEKDNKFSYVNKDQLELLDALHEHISKGGTTNEFVKSVHSHATEKFSTVQYSPVQSSTTTPINGQWVEVYDRITKSEKPLSFQLVSSPPPSHLLDNHRILKEVCESGYYLPTSRLLPLLGRKSIPKLDDHSRFRCMGFVFWRVSKAGREFEWHVTKA